VKQVRHRLTHLHNNLNKIMIRKNYAANNVKNYTLLNGKRMGFIERKTKSNEGLRQ
jgi:hypothetical protein